MKGAVLFDLDGTLADTAPDLAAAVNRMRADQGLEPMPIGKLRPFASAGARGLVFAGMGVKPGDAEYDGLRETFLWYNRKKKPGKINTDFEDKLIAIAQNTFATADI